MGAPVSLAPYLNQLDAILQNQYLLTFLIQPSDKKKGDLRDIEAVKAEEREVKSCPSRCWCLVGSRPWSYSVRTAMISLPLTRISMAMGGRIPFPWTISTMTAALRQRSTRCADWLRAFIGDRKEGFIFPIAAGTAMHQSNFLRRSLHSIFEKLGIKKQGFHGFRRYRVTHLESCRVPPPREVW